MRTCSRPSLHVSFALSGHIENLTSDIKYPSYNLSTAVM